jgi:hypothetical protein
VQQNNFDMVSNDNRKHVKPLTVGLIAGAGLCLIAIIVLVALSVFTSLKSTSTSEMSKEDQEKVCFNPDLAQGEVQNAFRKAVLKFGACYDNVIPDGELRYRLPEYGFFATISSTYTLRAEQTDTIAEKVKQAFEDEGFVATEYTIDEHSAGKIINFISGEIVCDYWENEDGYYTVGCADKAQFVEVSEQLKPFHDLQPLQAYRELKVSSYDNPNNHTNYKNALVYGDGNAYQIFFAKNDNWELVLSDTGRVSSVINCPPNEGKYFDKMWVINQDSVYCADNSGNLLELGSYWN